MSTREFSGFGGNRIVAEHYGSTSDPAVLVLHGDGQDRSDYAAMARALSEAGRHVLVPDCRPDGSLEEQVGDLRAILAQLSARPAIVGLGQGAVIAAATLAAGEPDLATGLVLVADSGTQVDARPEMPLRLPTLMVRAAASDAFAGLGEAFPDAELVETEDAPEAPSELLDALLIEFLERRVPRSPTEYIAGSDPRTLRDALGTFATGVTVVTARGADGTNVGLTANSFTSVSLDPPLLLVCPHRMAHSLAVLSEVDHFAVNVLHIGQQAISDLFARRSDDRFDRIDWEVWDHGPPIITNSLASFECAKYAEYDGGDHVILVGEVKRVRFAPQRDPLLYFRGKYRRLHFA